ncbi:McbB family protein [Pseudomonas moorei]|jgi:McbB family protein|uniref:McbB family protein n=1 Tax=Pseudomonas moorei TaxID=395599 RepID=A0A1H1FWC8_9PSED|nr:McbB family protein [Pseudomonas moorei]KAB0509495.1 McbB family protein [Pseudomonas moorei]SDR04836.1 McbB family protein [Pseudomonas moorei]
MQLIFSEFDIVSLPNESLIISINGASKTESKKLLNVLQELKKQKLPSIPKALFDKIVSAQKLPLKETYRFLNFAIGLKNQPSEIYFKKVLIAHDWGNREEFEAIIDQEIKFDYEIVSDFESLIDRAQGNAFLIKIICMQYNYSKLKNLYFCLADSSPSSAISIGYLNGGTFRISQPYIPNIGNPCHFCLVERQLNYERINESRNSWSALLNFCVDQNITTPSPNLSLLQRNLALGTVIKKIKLHTEHNQDFRYQDNSLASMSIDLNSGLITEELTTHWHSCTCLRSKYEKYST